MNFNQQLDRSGKADESGNAGEAGQAMVEYVILVVVVGLSTLFMMTRLPQAVGHYVEPFFYTFSRPFP